jgi:molecular chaperone GrpE
MSEADDKNTTTSEAPVPFPGEGESAALAEDGAQPEIDIEIVDDEVMALAELEAKLAEEHDRLLRTAAELDNVRKRARRDVDDALTRGRAEILNEILPTIDALDLAIKNADEATPARAVIDGVEMVRRQFLGSMGRFGMRPIECLGAAFDPNFHEAVAQIPSGDIPAGSVMEELRRGYVLGSRLLRASLVVVSSGQPDVVPTPVEEESDD